jgi:hypothetical protein
MNRLVRLSLLPALFVTLLIPSIAQAKTSAAQAEPATKVLAPPVDVGAGFWQWALTQPPDKSPLLASGNVDCSQGQHGDVWYLAGDFGGTVVRNCTVPSNKALAFPIINNAYFAFPDDPANTKTPEFLRTSVLPIIRNATDLHVWIDGIEPPQANNFLRLSPFFEIDNLPPGNLIGDPSDVAVPCFDAGYYVKLAPLTPGPHVIRFSGEEPGFSLDVTYNLTVS